MKTMLTASLLALASTVVGAGPVYAGTTHSSLFTPEQGNPGNPTLISGVAVTDPQEPAQTSLDQFEQGDPDATVTAGYHYTGPAHHSPPGPVVTSLAQFEKGDPDTTPGG